MENDFLDVKSLLTGMVSTLILLKAKWLWQFLVKYIEKKKAKKELIRYGGSLISEMDDDLKSDPHVRLFFLKKSNLMYNVQKHCFSYQFLDLEKKAELEKSVQFLLSKGYISKEPTPKPNSIQFYKMSDELINLLT